MRSRVLKAADYRSVDIGGLLKPFEPDAGALEAELHRLANPYIRWEEGERVSAGDQAVCRLVSDCPRFNKEKVRFVAGSGMFHRELEALAIGMKAGETREAVLPEGGVALTVTGVMDRIVPEPSDEMVEKLGLEGVDTVADYRAYLLAQQKEAAFQESSYEPINRLMGEVIRSSEFVLCREDWAAAVNRELDRCQALCRQEGMVLEDIAAEIPFLNIVKLNTTENPELAAEYQITAVPTVHFYKDGELVASHVGVMQPQAVKDVIAQYMYA